MCIQTPFTNKEPSSVPQEQRQIAWEWKKRPPKRNAMINKCIFKTKGGESALFLSGHRDLCCGTSGSFIFAVYLGIFSFVRWFVPWI